MHGKSGAYYNEIDLFAAQWLRNLIDAGHIPPGDVDERSITEVQPDDLRGYRQCHFFAGIGGWGLAARLAGWPDDSPLWTGSCPCQPFSVAGKGRGTGDERHLWPVFRDLISECRPPVVAGEQVASKAGRSWLSGVRADMEALGYAVGAADLCAAGVGAPHIRQRLWFVASQGLDDAASSRRSPERPWSKSQARDEARLRGLERGRGVSRVAGATGARQQARPNNRMGVNNQSRWDQGKLENEGASSSDFGPWGGAVHIPCGDGKVRPIKPGLEPLAHGIPGRVGRLRAYGNAIVPQLAAEILTAWRPA